MSKHIQIWILAIAFLNVAAAHADEKECLAGPSEQDRLGITVIQCAPVIRTDHYSDWDGPHDTCYMKGRGFFDCTPHSTTGGHYWTVDGVRQ